MINELGEKLVRCDMYCEGVNNDPQSGIIPRCLILEKQNGKSSCIVVGLNPGKCRKEEREYYLRKGIKYDSLTGYFLESKLRDRPYFKRTREFISQLGFNGDILWTDLAKCECLDKNGKPPVQTLRVCIDRFLRKEVNVFEQSTIFALGNVAFDFCALSFPTHFVVGLPHPTGSHGDFVKLKAAVTSTPGHFIGSVSKAVDNNGNYRAVHLSRI